MGNGPRELGIKNSAVMAGKMSDLQGIALKAVFIDLFLSGRVRGGRRRQP
jgi:hypothetical protein